MPSDPTQTPPPSSGKQRRRPNPGVGGNWVWLVILLLLVGMFLANSMTSARRIDWNEFYALLKGGYLKKVVLVGAERIEGELKDLDKFHKELEDRLDRQKEQIAKLERERNRAGTKEKKAELGKQLAAARQRRAETQSRLADLDRRLPELKKKITTGKFTVQRLRGDDKAFMEQLDQQSESSGLVVSQTDDHFAWMTPLVMIFLPAVLLLLVFLFLLPRFRDPLGGGFLSNYIKSPAKRYERSKMRVTFDDVAGMQSAKSELQEVVEFLRSPEKFQRLGAVIPKGILLVGPPGTGKTLLARAVAGEAGVPFFSISGSEFIQMFVGVGASRVRDMFKTAKENSPCILFIDEIDAVGRMRGAGVGGGSDEREQTLNQILSEMDGFTPTEAVIVMAATNRPDVLDSALLRPGRFDRHITIDRPTWQGRLAILKVHTRNKPLADDVNLEQTARSMIGMTGADLRNLANEAALLATREGKNKIDRRDFERASDRVLMGPKREEVLTAEGKRKTAYHEVGHTLVAWLEPEADPPQKVSIIPRGRALGVSFNAPDEDRYHHGLDYWKARLAVLMGGRAADRLVYGQPFSGHEDDLKQATRLARYMVTHWGMSDRLGPMSFRVGEEHVFLGKEIQEPRDFSEGTAKVIDEEVSKLLREADEHAYELLKGHRDMMERLVEALLQREELMRDEIDQVLKENNNGIVAAPLASGEER
jgi:cell division protease FtsH